MTDLLLAVAAVAVLGALALAALVAVTVVPFVVGLQRADRRGASPARTGAAVLGALAVGLLIALALLRRSAPLPLAVAPVLLGWAAAVSFPGSALAGRRGVHERSAGVEHPEGLGEPPVGQ